MRYPDHLKPADTIGFAAPSFGCATEPYLSAFKNALKNFENMGYATRLGPNCYSLEGIGISNSPEACGKELTDMYTDRDCQALISCGGGELMCETISYVDFEAVKAASPKWFTGYSDNTNFTFLLTTLCDVASLYGPCAAAYGMEPWHKSIKDALDILEGRSTQVESYDKWEFEKLKDEDKPLQPYNCTMDNNILAFDCAGNATPFITMKGRLIGGCMDCLVNLLGTRFDRVGDFLEKYKDDGFIWFLEACDLNVFSIRRAMWQMYEAGWFKYCKGFIVGRPLHFGEDMMGLDQCEAVLHTARLLKVPAVMDADLGHLPPSMPIICGSIGNVDFKMGKLTLDFELK